MNILAVQRGGPLAIGLIPAHRLIWRSWYRTDLVMHPPAPPAPATAPAAASLL